MNRNLFQTKEDKSLSRILFFGNSRRAIVAIALLALVPATAAAQYPAGGASPSYGSKGAVIGGVAAGAAVGAGLLYWKFHNRPSCKAAWPVTGTSWSMRRTTRPTASPTR